MVPRSTIAQFYPSLQKFPTGVTNVAAITTASETRLRSNIKRQSSSSPPSEARFIVENDLSKMTQDLGGLRDVTIEKDTYLFGEGKIFDELEMHQDLFLSLKALGKEKATSIQALSFQKIISGKDAIIAAETGSGKTLAYLLPLIHQLLVIEDLGGLAKGSENDIAEEKRRENLENMVPWYGGLEDAGYPKCMIMVPNKELCSQVLKMATEVCDALRKVRGRLVTIEALTSFNGIWPYSHGGSICPNIIVCTPAYIGNYIRGPHIQDERIFRNIRCLVIDEADMVLEGSYQKEVEKVMDAFKIVRRRMIREGEIEIHTFTLQNLLVAATLPSFGLKSTEKYIQKRYPRAVKISNSHLHKHHPRIKQEYIELDDESEDLSGENRVQLIVNAIGNVKSEDENRGGTMVFVNTADKAARLAVKLRKNGIKCAEFHKLMRFEEKERDLKLFQDGKIPVLVCTDHASRGLDLPGVYHVIQAEFALNVVNHLHRIGRASRAGNYGRATNLYGKSSKNLVQSILSDVIDGKVDQSFSRRRGLRARVKKNNFNNKQQ